MVTDHDSSGGGDMCDLWKRLGKAVCRKRTDKRKRIAVEDSKKLKLPNDGNVHPLKFLERGVLAFQSCLGDAESKLDAPSPQPSPSQERERGSCAVCDGDLFQSLNVAPFAAPWYGSTTPLPVAQSEDELRIAISRLKRTLENEGVACSFMRCEAIDAESFNRQVEMMGTKSSVNFCAVMRLVDAIWKRWPGEQPHIVVDRQGGRMRYISDLMTAYPEARVQILDETELLSQYKLNLNGSEMKISFAVEAEQSHLPVALASMTAKYVRELFMMRLNRYFQALMPELKATAGYTEDARRYLTDIQPVIANSGIDRRLLVRSV